MRTIPVIAILVFCFWVQGVHAAEKPKIRVGLFSTTNAISLSANSIARVQTADAKLATIPANETVIMQYTADTGEYLVITNQGNFFTHEPVTLKPNAASAVVTITSYTNAPAWNPSLNDNMFYGAIELNQTWVVNKLGIENYVKGVSEASNSNPTAYLKTLYTAARTYAYYHYTHPTKHAGTPYLLDTTANDQVYRGYGFTQRSPNVAAAVDATKGTVIMYGGAVAITPYFSQSDGRTRSYSEVWNADYPYLQSVEDPCCTEDELLGHGVGLSAKGARYFASKEHWHWKEILQYYYQNVSLETLW